MKKRQARADGKAKEMGASIMRARLFYRSAARRSILMLILCFALFDCAAVIALAQSASPSPTPSAQAAVPQQQVRNLSDIAVRFVPAVKRTVEGAMLKRYTFLAMVFAQIIMLATFIKLQADRPGEIVTDQVNIDTRAMGGISLSSQYLGRTSENNRSYSEERTEIEQTPPQVS